MAFSLHFHLPFRPPINHPSTTTTHGSNAIRCGPRDNRGPLHKGRILSIEAIQAVQSLKRSQNRLSDSTNKTDETVLKTLSRLVKADLIAVFNELLRQDQFDLAVMVFSTVRLEEWYKTDLNLYAKLVTPMKNKGMTEEIDHLISELTPADVKSAEGKGLVTLIKALLAADMAESTIKIYEMMKLNGWNCDSPNDVYVGKVLSRGLKRLRKKNVADEIDREIARVSSGGLEKTGV